jgi:hypothetical protein
LFTADERRLVDFSDVGINPPGGDKFLVVTVGEGCGRFQCGWCLLEAECIVDGVVDVRGRGSFLALASWCARTGVWRLLVPDGAAPAGRWPRTNWRAPTEIDWTDGTVTRRRSKTQHQKQTPIVCYRLWGETWRLLQQYGNRIGDHALLTTTGKAWVRDEIIEGKRHRVDAIRSAYRHLKIPFTLKSLPQNWLDDARS